MSSATITDRPTGNGAATGLRPLPRRRTLPNGRAALGGLLVALATVVLFSLGQARSGDNLAQYVVARHPLTIGTTLGASDLTTASLHLPAGSLRNRVFARVQLLVGAVVIAPVERGELVQASSVIDADAQADIRQISVPVESARALGETLRAGELVDVVATFGTGTEAFTVTVVSGAKVVGRTTGSGPLDDRKGQVVLLAVRTADEGMAVAHAVAAGQISLVRVSGVATGEPAAPYRAPKPAGR